VYSTIIRLQQSCGSMCLHYALLSVLNKERQPVRQFPFTIYISHARYLHPVGSEGPLGCRPVVWQGQCFRRTYCLYLTSKLHASRSWWAQNRGQAPVGTDWNATHLEPSAVPLRTSHLARSTHPCHLLPTLPHVCQTDAVLPEGTKWPTPELTVQRTTLFVQGADMFVLIKTVRFYGIFTRKVGLHVSQLVPELMKTFG
jgi:hypothetical protein